MTIPVIVAGGADHIGAGRDYLKHLQTAGSFEDACPTAAKTFIRAQSCCGIIAAMCHSAMNMG